MTHEAAGTGIAGTETRTTSVRDRFGGIDTPAALGGMLTALGTIVFLSSLIAAGAGSLEFQLNVIDVEGNVEEIAVVGAIVAAVVVFVAFLVGGWAAGRMARYDGGINGLATGLWMLLLVAIFAALGAFVGAEYNAFQQAGLPDWISQLRGDDVTAGAIIAAVVMVAVMFAGGYLGGKMGEAYHRTVDAALTDPRTTGRTRTEPT